jgi:hypothetical protein
MEDRPVDADRLEVIDSGSAERLYSAMRDHAERGREFQRHLRGMWLHNELSVAPAGASVIDLRGALSLSSTLAPLERRQEESA